MAPDVYLCLPENGQKYFFKVPNMTEKPVILGMVTLLGIKSRVRDDAVSNQVHILMCKG